MCQVSPWLPTLRIVNCVWTDFALHMSAMVAGVTCTQFGGTVGMGVGSAVAVGAKVGVGICPGVSGGVSAKSPVRFSVPSSSTQPRITTNIPAANLSAACGRGRRGGGAMRGRPVPGHAGPPALG